MSSTTPSVIDLLRGRLSTAGSARRPDGASVALVVEGGAMRGVISAGMVSALEALGYADVFDAVYGASAGAINAAYFLAGQARLGTTIYHEDINNRRFIDLARPLWGRPVVDLDFLIGQVARRDKPLDASRILGAHTPLRVLATHVTSERAHQFGDFADADALFGALRAGATMPVVAGDPFPYEGALFLDASLSEPIPVPSAEAGGHTHVLALLTRGRAMRPRVSAFDRYFVGPRLRKVSPGLAASYLNRAEPYAAVVRAIDGGTGPSGRSVVHAIRVDDLHIGKLERNADLLREGARRGYEAVARELG